MGRQSRRPAGAARRHPAGVVEIRAIGAPEDVRAVLARVREVLRLEAEYQAPSKIVAGHVRAYADATLASDGDGGEDQ